MDLSRRDAMAVMAVAAARSVRKAAAGEPARSCCPIVELRQYRLQPGKRDTLIALFDREFVESQEALGATIIGQFRNLDDPDRFVWLRGFADMPSRAAALSAFYGGPVWKAHREAANATMIDVDNVLLLHPAKPTSGFQLTNASRPPQGALEPGAGIIVAYIYSFATPVGSALTDFFEQAIAPAATKAGASVVAQFATEKSPNNFPALPVREGENVFVWFARFDGLQAYKDHVVRLTASREWRAVALRLRTRLKADQQTLVLQPTARSMLHG